MSGSLYLLVAALAWSAIVATVALHFFKEGDALFERIVDSGAKGLAESYLESAELLPVIAGLVERVVADKAEKQKVGFTTDYETILQEVGFRDEIERAQDIIVRIDQIDRDYEELVSIADGVWRTGALHIVSTIGTTVVFLFVTYEWRDPAFWILTLGAAFFLISMARRVNRYARNRKRFMCLLKECRHE